MTTKKTAILISGRGSNMAALIEAAKETGFPAEIVCVISDTPGAAGLVAAAQYGIPTRVLAREDHATKEAHDAAIDAALRRAGVEIVALAGYMRLLTHGFVEKWRGRMINIHPSLLPLFRGLETHRKALAAGVKLHGCTVHFVIPEVDSGPIIAQAAVPVLADDTEPALAQRVLKAEHRLYPIALRLVAQGRARMEGEATVLDRGEEVERGSSVLLAPELRPAALNLEELARFTP